MKTFKIFYACSFVLVIACQKESGQPSLVNSNTQTANATAKHYIGEHYGGGIIFFISKNGERGLIAATEDLKPAMWYNNEYVSTRAFHGALWRGCLNTSLIINAQGKPGDYAALMCTRYQGGGYTDWYLPSVNELQALYQQRDVVGGFIPQYYWTSTENGDIYAETVFFGGEFTERHLKSAVHNVRPIRTY